MSSLKNFTENKLDKIKKQNRYRETKSIRDLADNRIIYDDKILVSFASNDYLGLKFNKTIIDETIKLASYYGLSSCSSRFIAGNYELYEMLETEIALYRGYESSYVFSSGYLANIGVIPSIVDHNDLVVADKLIHASLIDGIKLSGAKLIRYSHNDLERLKYILDLCRNNYRNCLIITESIFSMDGDRSDIDQMNIIKDNYNSWLMVDDAHGLGNTIPKIDILVGTFSKSFASYGGYVCADYNIIDYIKNSAKTAIYNTSLPAYNIANSIASIKYIKNNYDICRLPVKNAKVFCDLLSIGKPNSHILPIVIGEEKKTIDIAKNLIDEGFFVASIRPPTVANGSSRIRLSFAANHKYDDIIKLANYMKIWI